MTSSHLYHFGQMIRKMREAGKMSQKDLADACVLKESDIEAIEAGEMNFEINTLVRIATALNCYLDVALEPVK